METGGSDPDRRRVLGLAAGLAGLAAPAVARADTPVSWRLATAWPKDARGGAANARRMAEMIASLSGGRLTVQVFAAGELADTSDLFDAVAAGAAELGHGSSADWTVRDPAFHFLSGVPFGLTGHEHAAWLRFGGGQALWRRACEPFGVVPFLAGSIGVPGAGWFRDSISRPADLMNLPIRAAGLSGELWRRLGANVVATPPEAIVEACAAGMIAAAEWMGPWRDFDLGLAAVAKNYYVPGFRSPGPSIGLIANRAAYDALADDLKAAVRVAAGASAMETYADFTYNNITVMQSLAAAGVSVQELPAPIVLAAGREAEALLSELGTRSPIAGETYRSFAEFRRKANAYASAGDEAALRLRKAAMTK
jgi:TRAP-type mannitol/chloroaromatic compound transport system substrate-binding protein